MWFSLFPTEKRTLTVTPPTRPQPWPPPDTRLSPPAPPDRGRPPPDHRPGRLSTLTATTTPGRNDAQPPVLLLAIPAVSLVQFLVKGVPFVEEFSKVRCCALPRVHCSA